MKKIALDVDGVLLDWYYNAVRILGIPKTDDTMFPRQWGMPFISSNWGKIANDERFWKDLDPMCDPSDWVFTPHVYLTSMPKHFVHHRVKNLIDLGFPPAHVEVSSNKMAYCLENEIDLLVDDKPATVAKFVEFGHHDKVLQFMPFYGKWGMVDGLTFDRVIESVTEVNHYL